MKNGQKKSFHGPGKSPKNSQTDAKLGGGKVKGSDGSKGRAYPPGCDSSYKKKGNP